MKIYGIDHVGIITSNTEKSVKFYCDLLDFKLIKAYEVDDMKVAYYTNGIVTLEFLEPKIKDNIDVGIKHVAYKCENIDKYAELFINSGIKIANNKVNKYEGMKYIFTRISKGHYIELVEYTKEDS